MSNPFKKYISMLDECFMGDTFSHFVGFFTLLIIGLMFIVGSIALFIILCNVLGSFLPVFLIGSGLFIFALMLNNLRKFL